MIKCMTCGTSNQDDAKHCLTCGTALPRPGPPLPGPGPAPPSPGPVLRAPDFGPARPPQGDATGGLIPYKNAPALVAYYLGLFSILPVIGILLGIPSLILGIVGLKKRRREPHVKGAVHAWIGIGCGALSILVWSAVIVLIIVGTATSG